MDKQFRDLLQDRLNQAKQKPLPYIYQKMEKEWLPAMCRLLAIDRESLPVIWDADFLYGPKTAAGEDSYVLCEINVSSVYPFPESALEPLAQATSRRLRATMRA